MRRTRARAFIVFASVLAAVCGTAGVAANGAASAQAACTRCELVGAAPTATITLNGSDQAVTYSFDVTVDGTGISGWNMTVTSTTFATSGSPIHRLSTTASTITSVDEACASGKICITPPTNCITYPLVLPAGTTAPTPAKFYDASVSTGVGTFTMTPTVSVAIPANAYAGTYTSELTLAFSNGP